MYGQRTLQGLRHAARQQGTPRSAIVLDMKTDQIYRPMQPLMFFADGSVAHAACEPQLMCDRYLIKVKGPLGRKSWVPVSSDTYRTAVIGKAFTG